MRTLAPSRPSSQHPADAPTAVVAVTRFAVLACLVAACGSDDRVGRLRPDVVLQPGFGVPCAEPTSCPTTCVPHAGDAVCSQACDADRPCPAGWSCFSANEEAGVCVSSFAALCRPCTSDIDCAPVDAAAAGICVDHGGAGRFCATPCSGDSECPGAGFACSDRLSATKVCLPSEGICPCTPYLESLFATTPCSQTNTFGTCGGERTCVAPYWSACTAPTPALDLPNGIDDDCDGLTDEATCRCGDGICDLACAETLDTCPCDCAVEGDGICSPCGESPMTAPVDCCRSPGGAGCGDGYCLGFGCGENPTTCPRDCSTPCGNQICERGETPYNCAEDCQYKVCGNGICESSDGGPEQCPGDCAAFCGNCRCEVERDESVFNCPIDCGFCGDGNCSPCANQNEDRETCPADCCEARLEECNGIDDDCDGETDEEDAIGCRRFYRDEDRDGLGRWDDVRCLCAPDEPHRTPVLGDCDDGNPAIGRGTPEICNGRDDDCDGEADEDFGIGEPCELADPCRNGVRVCDGAKASRCGPGAPRAADTPCGPGACEGVGLREASRCDGLGSCRPGPLRSCAGFFCFEVEGEPRCSSACDSDTGCGAAYHCAVTPTGRACAPDLARGEPCGRDAQCATGFCRDGVCCEAACEAPCHSCARPGNLGVCRANAAGSDPDDECGVCRSCDGAGACIPHAAGTDPDEDCSPRPPCGETGVCDGSGACAVAGADVVCGAALCVGSTVLLERRCTGLGACEEPSLVACEGFVCEAGGVGCATSCMHDGECQAGFFCEAGSMACRSQRGLGVACGRPGECASGFCVDGVCCESSCAGVCRRCDVEATAGSCMPVSGPSGLCADTATCVAGSCLRVDGERCNAGGQCASGHCVEGVCCGSACAGVCETCATGTCASLTAVQSPGRCDGEKWCGLDGQCQAIEGAACAGGCARGRVCVGGVCQRPAPLGTVCGDGIECASGHCVDGVCCESACLGECRRCRGDGRCEYLPVGTEEPGDCPAADLTCGAGGVCGAIDGSVCGRGAECASGFCVDGACCESACGGVCEECLTGVCRAVVGAADEDTCGAPSTCFGRDLCLGGEGETCTRDDECGSGHCAMRNEATGIGVCCDRGCEGPCETCVGAVVGVCEDVVAGENPGRCEGELWCDLESACVPVSGSGCGPEAPCGSGAFCEGGVCVPLRADGEPCGRPEVCASGWCVDEVCCVSNCENVCERCDLVDGECLLAETGTDPDLECGGGFCSREAGGCAGATGSSCGDDRECASGHCEDGMCCDRECSRCDLCSAGVCMPVSGETSECRGDRVCRDGVCLGREGTRCGSGAECVSGHCSPERFCCASTCTRACDRCSSTGGCERVSSADNPGRCEGPFTCDAMSECVERERRCFFDDECAPEEWCEAGNCRMDLSIGAACERWQQCLSAQCVDGVCCAEECGGLCEACNLVGHEGICEPIPMGGADPEGSCVDGTCDGHRSCIRNNGAFCHFDAECRSRFCADQTCCDRRCDKTCEACDIPGRAGFCSPIELGPDETCNGTRQCVMGECRDLGPTNCLPDGPCPDGMACIEGTCRPLLPDGSMCGSDDECQSRRCVEGRCQR